MHNVMTPPNSSMVRGYAQRHDSRKPFSKSKIKLLGQVTEASGVRADADKVKAIKAMREPINVSEVRGLLEMINHLGKFLPYLAGKTCLLRDLLKKSNMWAWGSQQQEAFD